MKYYISLGSNIGERKKNLDQALSLLEKNKVKIVKESSLYETSPVGTKEQPWFLNQVLEIQTELEPTAFLRMVQEIEKKIGRIHTVPKGPRCIDIDIILAENRIVRTLKLIIPHSEMTKRNFVLVPLKEIACEAVHPVLNKKIGDLLQKSKDESIVSLYVSAKK